jgi:hypothetical protein
LLGAFADAVGGLRGGCERLRAAKAAAATTIKHVD